MLKSCLVSDLVCKKEWERTGGTRRRISIFFSEEGDLLLNIQEVIAEKHWEGGTKRQVK